MDSSQVTVVIPAYRAAKYIPQAVRSALEQTIPPAAVIVVNDGSPDTAELEEALQAYIGRITYLKKPNGGPASARNAGIHRAETALIAFLDADDYWAPRFLEEQSAFLARRPEVDLVYCDSIHFSEATGQTRRFMESNPQIGEPTFSALLAFRCSIGTSTVVARRQAVLAVGAFDETIGNYSEDYDLYLRLAHAGATLAYQKQALVYYRVHGESLTSAPLKLTEGALGVLTRWSSRDLSSSDRAALTLTIDRIRGALELERGKVRLAEGDFHSAEAHLAAAHRACPSWKLRLVLTALRIAPRTMGRWQAGRNRRRAGMLK
jgi:glycosyltransferase involved in cell wall biosynthesis